MAGFFCIFIFYFQMNLQPILHNELVTLIPLQKGDFDELYNIASDELLWEQHPNNDRFKKEVFEEFFNIAIASKGAFKIIDTASNQVIGSTRFYNYDENLRTIVIGYTFIDRKLWGTSYNSSVKHLMIDYAFQFVKNIHFHVGETNFRSQKAVEKLGAKVIGEIKDDTSLKTNWIYAITKNTI